MDCKLCDLTITSNQVVLGVGNNSADIMLIGEAPGYYEDKRGVPFVGKSGEYLRSVLESTCFVVPDLFITNIVKCRPPNNRTPHPKEIAICTNAFLSREIQHINPIFVITAGKVATQIMLSKDISMRVATDNEYMVGNMWVFPIYHPSYILQNENLAVSFTTRLHKIRNRIGIIQHDYAFDIAANRGSKKDSAF